jgi:hypothetical protein
VTPSKSVSVVHEYGGHCPGLPIDAGKNISQRASDLATVMNEKSWLGFLISLSGNLKAKIQNRQSLGVSVIAFVLTFGGVVAQAQQPKKVKSRE